VRTIHGFDALLVLTGSTFSNIDRQDMSNEDLARELKLMQAAWALFDDVRSRVWAGRVASGGSAT
jgi:hypothetical protein